MDAPVRSPSWSASASRPEALSDALLALSIILTGASGFRISGLPVGPGEACLLIWIGVRGWQELAGRSAPTVGPLRVLAMFWVALAIAQSAGLLMTMASADLIDWPIVSHDIAAFAVMLLLSTLCVSLPDPRFRFIRIVRYMTIAGGVSLSLQVASAWDLVAVPGIDPWYWDRFRGWADNPNQLSLFCALLVPIALFGAETSQGLRERLAALACASAALTAGLLTKGNSLRLALVVGLGCAGAIVLGRLVARRARPKCRERPLALVVVGVPVLLLSGLPFLATMRTEDIAKQVSRDSTQALSEAALRFELWKDGFDQGVQSFYVGLGPGPHARVPFEVVVRQRWEPGAYDASLGDVAKHGAVIESHNTYIELFSQGGIAAVLAYLALLAYALRQSMASRLIALPALLFVIASFGIFHVIIRHPIVWFGLCLCLSCAHPPARWASARCRNQER